MKPATSQLDVHADVRGTLTVLNQIDSVPFAVQRIFWITGRSDAPSRGNHAHRQCHQLLVCNSGLALVDYQHNGIIKTEQMTTGHTLYCPPLTWVSIRFERKGVITVLCSHHYDEADYIHNLVDYKLAVLGMQRP